MISPSRFVMGVYWSHKVGQGNMAAEVDGNPFLLHMFWSGRAVYVPCRTQLGGTHDHTDKCGTSLWFSGNIIYLKFTYAGRGVYMHLGDVYLEHFIIVGT